MFAPFRIKASKQNKTAYLGFIMIFFVLALYFFLRSNGVQSDRIESYYPNIASIDLKNNYPKTPEELMDVNNEILFAMYNGGINDTEIALAILKQRELFAEELLELNPLEQMLTSVTNNILENKSAKVRMLSAETKEIVFDDISENIAHATVIQYVNNDTAQELKYYLVKQEEKWRILAWES